MIYIYKLIERKLAVAVHVGFVEKGETLEKRHKYTLPTW